MKNMSGLAISSALTPLAQANPIVPALQLLLSDEHCIDEEVSSTIVKSPYVGSSSVQRVDFRDYFLPVNYRPGDSGFITGYVERLLSARGLLQVRVYTEHGMNVSDEDYVPFDKVITLAEGEWYGTFNITINAHNRVGTGEIVLRMQIINSLSSLETHLDCPNADWGSIYLFDSHNRVPPSTHYVNSTQEFLTALNNPAVNYIGISSDIQQPESFMTGGGTSLQNRKVIFGANSNNGTYDSSIKLKGNGSSSAAIYDGKFLTFEGLHIEKFKQDNDPASNAQVYACNFINVTGLRIEYPANSNSSPIFLCKKGNRVFNCSLDTHISSEGDFRNSGAIHGYNYSETIIEACNLYGLLYNKNSLSSQDKSITVKRCRLKPQTGGSIQTQSFTGTTHHQVVIDRVIASENILLGNYDSPNAIGGPAPASLQGSDFEVKNCVIYGSIHAAWKQRYRIYNNLFLSDKPLWVFRFRRASDHNFMTDYNVIAAGKTIYASDAFDSDVWGNSTPVGYFTFAALKQAGFDQNSVIANDFRVIDEGNDDFFQRDFTPLPDSPLLSNLGHDGYPRGVVHAVGQAKIGAVPNSEFSTLNKQSC